MELHQIPEDRLVRQLKDLYSAEARLLRILPEMAEAAEGEALRVEFEEHAEDKKVHLDRLEEIAEELGENLTGGRCFPIEELIEVGNEAVSNRAEAPERDASLFSVAHQVAEYEIDAYRQAYALALQFGHEDVADLLAETLEEEWEAERKFAAAVQP